MLVKFAIKVSGLEMTLVLCLVGHTQRNNFGEALRLDYLIFQDLTPRRLLMSRCDPTRHLNFLNIAGIYAGFRKYLANSGSIKPTYWRHEPCHSKTPGDPFYCYVFWFRSCCSLLCSRPLRHLQKLRCWSTVKGYRPTRPP